MIAARPQPGKGTRITVTSLGTSVSVNESGANYLHPFRPSLVAGGVQLALGLVENRQPTIKGVPIGGTPTRGIPTLRLDAAVANANGESWVCVDVRPNDKGELPPESVIELVHTHEPRSIDPKLGRGTLCMILWRNRQPFRAVAIAMFNLRYARVLPPAGAGAVRHLFL